MLALHNILCPTDFAELSLPAVHVATALARDHGAKLTFLHVIHMPPVSYAEWGIVHSPLVPVHNEVMENLKRMAPADKSVECAFEVVDGFPGEEIVRVATENNCDLIVMSTHGRTGLGRLLTGSVAEEVLRKAPCPVLTIRSPMPAAEALEARATATATA